MADKILAEKEKNKIKDGLTTVLMRNVFYRDNYMRAKTSLLLVLFLNIFLAYSVVYRYLHPPEPQYFPTNSQYQLIKWHPLTDPVFDNNYVLQWSKNAVQKAFSLDFIHWRNQLQDASNSFTPSGWQWFVDAFKKSGNLKTLVNLQMVSNAVITGAPTIQSQGILVDKYYWEIEMPMMVTYTNVNRSIPQPMKITMLVVRVPVQQNKNRIAINQFLPLVQQQKLSE